MAEGQGLGRFEPAALQNLAGDELEGHPLIPIVAVTVRHFLGKRGRKP
ncbi:MAG TPA: hypothetical protein VD886_17595 [Herpetosiphonaceae bacterium]|nr:hypothetical protein [Herpetosiphonaceae bacterium]